MNREKIIAKLEKEVKRTYAIKTSIFDGTEKVSEEIIEKREPFVTITIEMADKILALLKEQEAVVMCKDCKHKEESVSPYWDMWCNRWHNGCDSDWFCADGERK